MSFWSRIERRVGDLADEILLDEFREQVTQARALLDADDPQAAAALLEALLAQRPGHGQALLLLGAARLALGNHRDARDTFELAVSERPGDPDAHLGLGDARLALGEYAAALESYGRAAAEATGDRERLGDIYRGAGQAWRRLGDTDKAIRELRKAVAEGPKDPLARAALAEALLADDGGDRDEAARHLDRVTAPLPAIAELARGLVLLREGNAATAGSHFARARDLADGSAPGLAVRLDALIGLGDAALAGGRAPDAHRAYLEAQELDPRRAEVHARLADSHRAIGDFEAALDGYQRALTLGGNHDVRKRALAAAIEGGAVRRAVPLATDLLAAEADAPLALITLAAAKLADGEAVAARGMLAPVAGRRDDPGVQAQLAEIDLADGTAESLRHGAAAALAALRVAPRHRRARDVLSRIRQQQLGRVPDGRAHIAELARAVERVVAVRPELASWAGEAARAGGKLDQPLLVTVMGEFSSGKSSLVNAFIGDEIAPTGITPTTATINVVRYGRERAGRIVHRSGQVTELPWDVLVTYLKALAPKSASQIDRVEILLPHASLEHINIVDTPGLNSILPEHQETAQRFIHSADAVVWLFTAGQGGKASEKKALARIRSAGKRVLGVLNKADQLSESDLAEVRAHLAGELGDLVETVVPISARAALGWRRDPSAPDGNWQTLAKELEERFFSQARQLKRDACAHRLRVVVEATRRELAAERERAQAAAGAAATAAALLDDRATARLIAAAAPVRRDLSLAVTALYRRAAREVLELVKPRRMPFGQHSATPADRDYLISLLDAGLEAALVAGRRQILLAVREATAATMAPRNQLAETLGADVAADLLRISDERAAERVAHVFEQARAYLRGYLAGGFVEAFFRADLPRLELSEDSVYHALVRNAPDLERELGAPLVAALTSAIAALADGFRHWGEVADTVVYDLEVGVAQALETLAVALSTHAADPGD